MEVVWRPQPGPQKALIDCPIPEVFYGGARGGGKTDGALGKYGLKAQSYGVGFNGVFFRRELPMLDDAIERSQEIYGPLGAKWQDQKKTWRFPWGGRLRFRPLESVSDAEKYQGQNVSDACVEEAGQYPDPGPIDRLNGFLRSARGTPTQLLLTGNPGGAGQHWIRKRYIDPAPTGMRVLRRKLPNGAEHRYVFIPSKLQNNRILLDRDPDYINRLYLVGSAELVRAWLEGDWSAIAGAYFDCWSTERHVIKPFTVPTHWAKFMSMDWGSSKPFSIGWWAISDGSPLPNGKLYPTGAMIRYREWYGASEPNVGIKLTAEQLAEGIVQREITEPRRANGEKAILFRVADPSCWKVDGGPCIAERMAGKGITLRPADNSRISGWDQLRARLQGDEDGGPMLYVFETCVDTIRTLPVLQHDENSPEDLDSDGEDHAADDVRYACMARPYTRKSIVPPPIRGIQDITMNELWKAQRRPNREGRI